MDHERSGDRPFACIEDIISREELEQMSREYKRIAGLDPGEPGKPRIDG